MGKLILLLCAWIVVFSPCCVQGEMREFKLPDGRSLNAEIVGYNAKLGLVELKREDGKRVSVKPEIFVEADQAYLKQWEDAGAFLSDALLKITCNSQVVESWKKEETENVRYTDGIVEENFISNVIKFERIAYEVSFDNKGASAMNGISMEYCILYEQSEMVWEEKPETVQKSLYTKMDVPELPGKTATKITTKSVVIHEDDINPIPQLDGDQRRPGKGAVHGIRVRLYMKQPNGETAMREFCQPSSLSSAKFPWTTETSAEATKKPKRRKKQ